MKKIKDENKKLNKSAKYLIASDLIYNITALFAETFLIAYFLKITNENIIQISLYYIIVYILTAIGNMVMGKLVKNKPKIRTKILSLGIIIRAIFILFIVILGDKLATDFIIVAIFCGISETLYWSVHELIYIDVTNNDNRKDYMSIKKILGTVVKIVAPIILGSSIELYSFTKIAIYVFILSIIQIIISLKINYKEFNSNNDVKKYDIKKYLIELKKNKISKIKKYYQASLIFGIIQDIMKTLVIVITIMTFKTSLNLGILTTIFSTCAIASIYLYKKYYNKNNSKKILVICSLLILIGIIGVLLNISRSTLIIYNFTYTVSVCILDAIYNTKKGDLIKECNIEQWNVEHIILSGFFMDISRIIGFTLMMGVGFINNIIAFKLLLLFTAVCVPIYSKLIFDIESNSCDRKT